MKFPSRHSMLAVHRVSWIDFRNACILMLDFTQHVIAAEQSLSADGGVSGA